MKRKLQIVSFCIFFLFSKVFGQTAQTVSNGQLTTAINFPGTACIYNWTNDSPQIGLPAGGTGNIAPFTAVNNGSIAVKATITATSASFAYIANGGDNTVSVINTLTNLVVATITVGQGPISVSVNPDGSRVYVTNSIPSTVSVINTATNTVVATIPVGRFTNNAVVSPDGSRVYATGQASISVIDTKANAVISTITVLTEAFAIAVSPDGSKLYVTNELKNLVWVISTATNAIIATVAVGQEPSGITISPDGRWVYTTNYSSNTVTVINTATNKVTATINVGPAPFGITISPDGRLVYVGNAGSNTVSVINTSTNMVGGTISTDTEPYGLSVTPDGAYLYTADANINSVSVFNTATYLPTTTIKVGSGPNSHGNFISGGIGCTPETYILTVNPTAASTPSITAGPLSGVISACAGSAAVSPNVQQFTVAGNNLASAITAAAPPGGGFEISLSPASGYSGSITLSPAGGSVNSTVIYVRSAASAPVGQISGKVQLTSAGAASQDVTVTGVVNMAPAVAAVTSQGVTAGLLTKPIAFSGTGSTYSWVNDTPGIGLAANGTGDIASFKGINNGSTPVTATITVTPEPAAYAYIANYGANSISIINTMTNVVTATIPLSEQPGAISVSPAGSLVYIANESSNNVSVISPVSNTIVATIPVGNSPGAVAISRDGSLVYVTNIADGTVSVIAALSNKVTGTISGFTQPYFLALSPAANLLYVGNSPLGTVSVVNTSTNTIIKSITVGADPVQVVVSPDGSFVYTANQMDNSVSVISAATNTVVATIPTGNRPYGAAISPDGKFLYVGCSTDGAVDVIDTKINQVVKTINVAGMPTGISVTADGSEVYVTNDNSPGTVSVISTATDAVVATVQVGLYPYSLGDFIVPATPCAGTPVTFTITVNPAQATSPTIVAGAVTGVISACAGNASGSPDVEQFTVFGSDLAANVVATAPPGFEISLSAASGFGNTVIITQSSGDVDNTVVYVRSAATASPGPILGNVTLSSPGATSQDVAVAGVVNDLPTVNTITGQVTANGLTTTAVNFTGSGDIFTWTNDTPAIGLPASGTGNIAAFTAINPGASPVIATVTVTPGSTVTGCTGAPETFTITVDPTPPTAVAAAGTLNPLTTQYGTPSPSEAFSVSGTTLTSGILVTPPTGFELSTDNVNFSATVTVGSGGNVSAQTVYIRLAAVTPVGPYSGNIKVTSPGATEVDLLMPVSTVTPALLAIIADDKSKTFATLNPPLTATYVGFVNFETVANLTTPPLLATTATTFSPVGQYPITVTGASSTNYTISYIDGTLTIAPTEQSIVIPNTFTPNGDGINDTWDIKFLDLFINCSVDIFTRWGQKVYTSTGYTIPWDGTYKGTQLPTGTYYYIINLQNGMTPLSGFVAIIR
jgi:gliding motility-associated-like protein